MLNVFAVFIGGGLGASLRYFVTMLSNKLLGMSYFGTFFVNIVGCFFIGLISGFFINRVGTVPSFYKSFLIMGLLGGLTTFSTFSNEAFMLFKSGKPALMACYIFASLIVGIFAVYLGYAKFKLV